MFLSFIVHISGEIAFSCYYRHMKLYQHNFDGGYVTRIRFTCKMRLMFSRQAFLLFCCISSIEVKEINDVVIDNKIGGRRNVVEK